MGDTGQTSSQMFVLNHFDQYQQIMRINSSERSFLSTLPDPSEALKVKYIKKKLNNALAGTFHSEYSQKFQKQLQSYRFNGMTQQLPTLE